MSNSLTFNGTDLSSYGLLVARRNLPIRFIVESGQLLDRSYAGISRLPPKSISLDVNVVAADFATLQGYLDNIQAVLNTQEDVSLILDALNDRYWRARTEAFIGSYRGPQLWQGVLDFICNDPFAYAIAETSEPYVIDADPDTITITVGGTAIVSPIYTLSNAGDDFTDIVVENTTTSEALTWGGTLLAGEELVIDTSTWYVYVDGVVSMAVSGQFPTLAPGVVNSIDITSLFSFGNDGALNITFRDKYI